MAPFVADDGVLYLGEKTSEYYLVDARTGLRDKVYTSPSANALKNSNDPSGTKSREGHVWEGGGGGKKNGGWVRAGGVWEAEADQKSCWGGRTTGSLHSTLTQV